MEADALFISTLNDLSAKVQAGDEYSLVRAAGLIRQLLLDGANSLVDKVNRSHRLKLEFVVYTKERLERVIMATAGGPSLYCKLDVFGPDGKLLGGELKSLSRDRFLSFQVIFAKGHWITVKDVILHAANVAGGVHHSGPKEDAHQLILQRGKGDKSNLRIFRRGPNDGVAKFGRVALYTC